MSSICLMGGHCSYWLTAVTQHTLLHSSDGHWLFAASTRVHGSRAHAASPSALGHHEHELPIGSEGQALRQPHVSAHVSECVGEGGITSHLHQE